MKREISLWQFAGFGFATLVGTLLHFLYDWTGGSIWTAPFSGVNESTWEHIKLIYVPLFLFSLIQYRFFCDDRNFWCIKLRGILTAMMLIPVLFYTYNGVFGHSPDWINISIFYITAALTFFVEWRLFQKEKFHCKWPWLAFALVCVVGVFFVLFTFITPKISLFEDPITGGYGIAP